MRYRFSKIIAVLITVALIFTAAAGTVSAAGISVTSTKMTITPTSITFTYSGQLSRITPKFSGTAQTVTYTSSDTNVAIVGAGGTVRAIDNGTCTITVKSKSGLTATSKITVNTDEIVPKSFSLGASLKLFIGDSYQLSPEFSPADSTNKTVSYKSSNTAVATVSSTGLVKAVGRGYGFITASSVSGYRQAKVAFYVSDANASIDVDEIYYFTQAKSEGRLSIYREDQSPEVLITTEADKVDSQRFLVQISTNGRILLYSIENESYAAVQTETDDAGRKNVVNVGGSVLIETKTPTSECEWKLVQLFEGSYALLSAIDDDYCIGVADYTQPLSAATVQKFNYGYGQRFTFESSSDADLDFNPVWPAQDAYYITGLDYYFSSGNAHGNAGAIDIGNGNSVPILACDDGVVIRADNDCSHVSRGNADNCHGGSGNNIEIRHANGYISRYLHLKKDTLLVKVGDTVTRGQQIATMGSSGRSTGTHLHFVLKDEAGNNMWTLESFLPIPEIAEQLKFSGTGPSKGHYYNLITTQYTKRSGGWWCFSGN